MQNTHMIQGRAKPLFLLTEVDRMTTSTGAIRVLEEHLTALGSLDSISEKPKCKEILRTLASEIEPIFQDITSINPSKGEYSSQIQESFQKCIKKLMKEGVINKEQEKKIQSQIHEQRGILAAPVVKNSFSEAGVEFIETIA